MRRPIYLDDEAGLTANKVTDILTYWFLSDEFEFPKLTIT